jgi:PII-like signaling protein
MKLVPSRIKLAAHVCKQELPMLDEMVGEGMLTLEKVHVVKYRARPSG